MADNHYSNLEAPREDSSFLSRLHIDMPLLIGLLSVVGYGLIVLYSAAGDIDTVSKQLVRIGIGLAAMLIVAQVSPDTLRRFAMPIFLVIALSLVAVLLFGVKGGGAQRWLDLGITRVQPSEFMKIALPITVAAFLHNRIMPPNIWITLASCVIVLAPAALIMKQPDLGTSILVASSGFFALFIAGLRWRYVFGAAIVALAAAPVMWMLMQPYQKQRVLTLLDPEKDPFGAGYHIIQSKIAIGSGGMFGKGWTNGTQAHLDFLPEPHTDFIFAVLAEEGGLMGVIPLLLLYLFIVFRGLYIAAVARKTFERALAGSLALTFFIYIFVNIGMVCGILPVVGVPLPLVSYGGTSIVTLLASFGILMSIHTRRTRI